MHPLSSDVQMGRVLTSTGNVMERMTARMILMNRIVVISILHNLNKHIVWYYYKKYILV